MSKIVRVRPPKRSKPKKPAVQLKVRIVEAKRPAEIAKRKRIELLRERKY